MKNFKVLCGITDVQSIMSVITDRFGNQFEFDKNNEPSKPDPLTNIAAGVYFKGHT